MYIREMTKEDTKETMALFYNTVHTINAADYDEKQLDAWAPIDRDASKWEASFIGRLSYVVIEKDNIIAFGDIDDNGYLDRFYVHRDYNHQGVGKYLLTYLENKTKAKRIYTHASITARPFFEHLGYRVVRKQTVERNDVIFINFVMEKLKNE